MGHWFSEYWVAASWPKDQTTGSMWPYRYARARFSRSHNLRVAKLWKCRLRLHDWDRENPESVMRDLVCKFWALGARVGCCIGLTRSAVKKGF